MRVTYRGLDEGPGWTVGFFEEGSNEFFRWRGVRLERDWVWPQGWISGPMTLTGDSYAEVLIDPPLDYVVSEGGLAAPGHYDRTLGRFYRWKGVRFDANQVPCTIVSMRRNVGTQSIFDIEVPAHLWGLAQCLDQTVKANRKRRPWDVRRPDDAAVEALRSLDEEVARELPIAYMARGDGSGWNVGHYDADNVRYLMWEGVVLPPDSMHWLQTMKDANTLTTEDGVAVVRINPPLDYIGSAGAPGDAGYLDHTYGRFYRWRNVRFDPEKVPAPLIGSRIDPALIVETVDVDAPAQRNGFKEYLAATTDADDGKIGASTFRDWKDSTSAPFSDIRATLAEF